MRRSRKLLAFAAVVVICLAAARLGISVTDKNKTYEFEQWITTPEYRTDAARAIDAYERLMERYMDLSEAHLMDCQGIVEKLDSIDARMGDFSARLARIEKAMGIDPNGNSITSKTKESGRTIKGK
jgi:hypothetical protein